VPTMPATGDPTTRTVEEQFLDLICSDQDLLAAEFDAIIAAEWPGPPANPAGRGTVGGRPFSGAGRWVAVRLGGAVGRARQPGIRGWARPRSPPLARPTTDRKAGDRHT
jgi:hypothetical protein